MPGLHSHRDFWRDVNETRYTTNVDIHTLVRELRDKLKHSHFLSLGTELPTFFQELRDETKTG